MVNLPPTVVDEIRDDAIEDLGLQHAHTDSTFSRVVQIASTALKAPNVAFSVLYQGEQIYLASCGVPLSKLPGELALCSITTRGSDVLMLEDARQSALKDHPGVKPEDGVRFYMGIPVRAPGGETIGSFCLFDRHSRKLSIAQQRMLGECAGLIEDALQLRVLASRDGLTGLLNRREFDVRLKAEFRRSRRDKTSLSLGMIDIDHFKKLNDRLGHDAGDEALKEVAAIIEDHVRGDRDVVCRFGGEEFAIIFAGLPTRLAWERMDHLRELISAAKLENPDAPLGVVSISGGVTSVREGDSVRDLVLRVDEALYRAKSGGRNQIVATD